MKKTVLDETIGKPVELLEYYKKNPTCMRLKKSFNLKCRKCGSPFLVIGIGVCRNMPCEKGPVFWPTLSCLKCETTVEGVWLVFGEKGWRMANEQKEY